MTDEVRSKLAGLSGLAVIASASASQYKATTKPPEQIAKELGVGYLLVAKVRWQKSGQTSRIRLTSELVELAGGGAPTTRWQEAFEADLSDVFRVQGEIATKVARSLEVALSGKERGLLTARPTSNLAAYDAYLKGLEIEKGGRRPDDATTRAGAVRAGGGAGSRLCPGLGAALHQPLRGLPHRRCAVAAGCGGGEEGGGAGHGAGAKHARGARCPRELLPLGQEGPRKGLRGVHARAEPRPRRRAPPPGIGPRRASPGAVGGGPRAPAPGAGAGPPLVGGRATARVHSPPAAPHRRGARGDRPRPRPRPGEPHPDFRQGDDLSPGGGPRGGTGGVGRGTERGGAYGPRGRLRRL